MSSEKKWTDEIQSRSTQSAAQENVPNRTPYVFSPLEMPIHFQPAISFEKGTGFSGIAGHYRFPKGQDATSIEAQLRPLLEIHHLATRLRDPQVSEAYLESVLAHEDYLRPTFEHFREELGAGYERLTFEEVVGNSEWRNYFGYQIELQAQEQLDAIYSKLEILNPQLAELDYYLHDMRGRMDIAYGVTSGFNISDIQHFLVWDEQMQRTGQFVENPKQDELEQRMGTMMAWRPSPETLDIIETQHITHSTGIALQPLPKTLNEKTYSPDGNYTFSDIVDPNAGRWISAEPTFPEPYALTGWKLHVSATNPVQLEALAAIAARHKLENFKLVPFELIDYSQSSKSGVLQGKTAVFYHHEKDADGKAVDWASFIREASHAIEQLGGAGAAVQKDRHVPGSSGIYYSADSLAPNGEYIPAEHRKTYDLGRTDDPFKDVDLTHDKAMPARDGVTQGDFTDMVKKKRQTRSSDFNLSA